MKATTELTTIAIEIQAILPTTLLIFVILLYVMKSCK